MPPFGYRTSRCRNRLLPAPERWVRDLRAFLVGNADLHGLVRCPPLARRWNRGALRICDVGCAQGDFHLEILLQKHSQSKVIGIDSNHADLLGASRSAAASGLASRVRYICASADALPFREGSFDQLFLVDVLEHVPDDQNVLREACRVLRIGGSMDISTPTPLYPKIFGRRIHRAVGHIRDGYSPAELRRRVETSRCRIVWFKQNTGFLTWPAMALWYRIAWEGLWQPKERRLIVGWFCRALFIFLVFWIRIVAPLDRLGGYCSNALEAHKTP